MKELSEHFNNCLWPKIISKSITNAEENLDKKFAKYAEVKNLVSECENKYQENLCLMYENKRDWLKKIYFGNFKTDEDRCLDMHKIAAIICRSIIGCKPFSFDVKKANKYKKEKDLDDNLDWIIDNYFINYKVAVNCAFAIILYDLFDRLGEKSSIIESNDEEIVNLIKVFSEQGFDMYTSSILKSEHETFYKSSILNLAINDSNKRDFDYLGFATICFQLQQSEIMRQQLNTKKKQA